MSTYKEPQMGDPRYISHRRHESDKHMAVGIAVSVGLIALGAGGKGLVERMQAKEDSGEPAITKTYTVQAGDTEWGLAERIAPNTDPRKTIYELDKIIPEDAAHQGHMIQPGDEIKYSADGKVIAYEPVGSSVSG